MRSGERFTIVSSTLRRNCERAEVAQERCSLLVRVGVRGSNPDSVIKVCAAEFDSIERIFRKIAPKTRKLFNSLGRKVKMKVVYSFPASRTVYFHTVHLFFFSPRLIFHPAKLFLRFKNTILETRYA